MQIDLNMIRAMSAEIRGILVSNGETEYDVETFLDSLDGECDAMDVIAALIREREWARAANEASKAEAKRYADRAARLADRADASSRMLGQVLDAMGERKVQHPLGTVSRTKGRTSVNVYDEAAIPSQLTKTVTKPDVAAIKAQLEAGETVPGAELVTGADGVTVRVL